MSVLVYIENDGNQIKKTSIDAISAARHLNQGEVIGIVNNDFPDEQVIDASKFGLSKAKKISNTSVNSELTNTLADLLLQESNSVNAKYILFGQSMASEKIAAKLGVKLKAAVLSNVLEIDNTNGLLVTRTNFTGKAFSTVKINTEQAVFTIKKNSQSHEEKELISSVEKIDVDISSKDERIKLIDTKIAKGDILLPEADLVVSAGRGLKGPENWGMIEELAKKIGAATACSKPVSDADWRPHHEHVGQTGLKISPNLYIAIGISGAIQHLAGVSSSKTIVVINTDSDAPFFKAADYGILGDAFEVIPKLLEALNK